MEQEIRCSMFILQCKNILNFNLLKDSRAKRRVESCTVEIVKPCAGILARVVLNITIALQSSTYWQNLEQSNFIISMTAASCFHFLIKHFLPLCASQN